MRITELHIIFFFEAAQESTPSTIEGHHSAPKSGLAFRWVVTSLPKSSQLQRSFTRVQSKYQNTWVLVSVRMSTADCTLTRCLLCPVLSRLSYPRSGRVRSSRVESGRVGSGRVGSGRVGSRCVGPNGCIGFG